MVMNKTEIEFARQFFGVLVNQTSCGKSKITPKMKYEPTNRRSRRAFKAMNRKGRDK
jgi:hypothetical protein